MIQTFIDDRDAQRRFARLQGKFAKQKGGFDYRTINELEKKFRRFAEQQFATEGAHGENKWAPLAERTIAMKAKKGTLSNGILRDSMEMYHMLTDAKSAEREWKRIPNGAQVAFRLGHFKFHQNLNSERMPPRQVYPDPLPQSFITELKNTISGFLLEGSFA